MRLLRSIFLLLLTIIIAGPVFAQPQPAMLQSGVVIGGRLLQADFNTTADQPITLFIPSPTYTFDRLVIVNPSCNMSAATVPLGGFYSAPSKGGVAIVAASQSYAGLTSTSINTTGSELITANPTTIYANWTMIYFSLSTAKGSACTADIYVYLRPQF